MTDEQHMPGCAALTTYRGIPANCNCELGRLRTELAEAEAALWRIVPDTHTISCEANDFAKPDPFEGPGETYQAAYERLRARVQELEKQLDYAIQQRTLAWKQAGELEKQLKQKELFREAWNEEADKLRDWQRQVVPELDRLVKIFGGYEGRPHDIERVRNLISEAEAEAGDGWKVVVAPQDALRVREIRCHECGSLMGVEMRGGGGGGGTTMNSEKDA